jgi:hypothetical protein
MVNNMGDGFMSICRRKIVDQEEKLQESSESIGQKQKRVKYTNPNLPHKCVKENIPFDTGHLL